MWCDPTNQRCSRYISLPGIPWCATSVQLTAIEASLTLANEVFLYSTSWSQELILSPRWQRSVHHHEPRLLRSGSNILLANLLPIHVIQTSASSREKHSNTPPLLFSPHSTSNLSASRGVRRFTRQPAAATGATCDDTFGPRPYDTVSSIQLRLNSFPASSHHKT